MDNNLKVIPAEHSQSKMMQIANIISEELCLLGSVVAHLPAITPNMLFLLMLLSTQTGFRVILLCMDKSL